MGGSKDACIITENRGGVGWIRLNRPRAMNALTPDMMTRLGDALQTLEADETIRCVVLTGTGKAFCAGVDLAALGRDKTLREATEAFMEVAVPVMERLVALPKPVIAAVNGDALAGGLELVLNCDLVIASDSARFGDAHLNFGLVPGGGGSALLPRRVGLSFAKYLIFTGEFATSAQMREAGLVLETVPVDALKARVETIAATIARKSPLSLARAKALIDTGLDFSKAEAVRKERLVALAHTESQDALEGIRAFAEKRVPQFTGH